MVAYAVLWVVSTQIEAIRANSPFSDDPWDFVASYSSIFLPVVAGATWVRSLRHREELLPAATARRIRWGSAASVAIVLAAVATDVVAFATVPVPDASPILAILVAIAGACAIPAAALLVIAFTAVGPATDDPNEPDVVDDALVLATEVSGWIGLRRPVGTVVRWFQDFLDRSSLSPRRHRIAFGILVAVAAGVGFDIWHAIVEGPWGTLGALLLIGALTAGGVFAIYAVTLAPLRLLRPVGGEA